MGVIPIILLISHVALLSVFPNIARSRLGVTFVLANWVFLCIMVHVVRVCIRLLTGP